ncbi:hypothetical protein [Propioniciclava tarda]|uniref:hypothetical protein n=1 Tax=Propioniciclava tarda TaxID=433330 RepID=UPI001169638C|nr:hypothetical protein [Propioniciclava tarda]SMO51286.1 hypothetical protein SAMN06266982_1058 [Propioniciclava tarda]HOA88702.1 hypothetical protein [Propioniciclava tarda]HQA30261.1 hypothetical protein [Propioniciclava tarda]HQD60080.1 hypothetical protein [Propioniciclava tarda]
MGKLIKNAIWALIVAFLIFYLVTRPEAAAGIVKTVFTAFDSIGRFFTQLAA